MTSTDCNAQRLNLKIVPAGDLLRWKSPDLLFDQFHSLGDGCQFGGAQRFAGVEPLGLLRWSSMPHRALAMLLDSRFADIHAGTIDLQIMRDKIYKQWFGI